MARRRIRLEKRAVVPSAATESASTDPSIAGQSAAASVDATAIDPDGPDPAAPKATESGPGHAADPASRARGRPRLSRVRCREVD